jgi:hypothetical protein
MTTSPLDAARTYLREQLHELDEAENYAERSIVSPLYDVADMVCRIGDHDSRHYRADKAGTLVSAAHEVRYVTLMAYGDAGETGDDDLLERLHDAEREIVVAVGHALWGIALDRLTESHLTHLGNALNALTRVAESLVRVAHPDVD